MKSATNALFAAWNSARMWPQVSIAGDTCDAMILNPLSVDSIILATAQSRGRHAATQ
jgi:hypothetical protein